MSDFASHAADSGVLAGLGAASGNGRATDAVAHNKIDEVVLAHLAKAGIAPAGLSSDEVFLRRAYLDTIGTLPTAQEAAAFLASADAGRRGALIDQLLARNEFPVYWAMKWSDLLRIKAEFPINLWPTAAQEYYRWLCESLKKNKPYDQFARELLTSSGSNFRAGPVNFYRAVQNREPQSLAQAVALTFMGVRMEKWPAARRAEMAVFYSQVGYKPTGEWKEGSIALFVGEAGGGRSRSVEKSKSGTFPLRLEIPQEHRDFHFPHRPCCDEQYSDFPRKEK